MDASFEISYHEMEVKQMSPTVRFVGSTRHPNASLTMRENPLRHVTLEESFCFVSLPKLINA